MTSNAVRTEVTAVRTEQLQELFLTFFERNLMFLEILFYKLFLAGSSLK